MEDAAGARNARPIMIRCFLAAAAGACASGATTWMQPVLFEHLIAQRGMHEAGAGLLITVELAAMSISAILMARFTDRNRAQFFALSGMTLAIVASFLSLIAPSDIWLFVARFFVGVGLGATIMVSNIIAANFPDPDKTFAHLGLVNLGYGAVAMAAYGQLTLAYHATTPFFFLMLSLMVLLPVMAMLPRFSQFDQRGAEMAHSVSLSSGNVLLRIAILATITFAIVLTSGTIWSLYSVIGRDAGLSPEQVNNAIAMSILAGFAGVSLPALVGGKGGRIIPFVAGLTTLAGAIFVLTSAPHATWFYVAVAANVAAIYFLMPYLSGAAAMIDGGGNAAAYIGSSFFFASAVSPSVAGVLISTVGIRQIGFVALVVAILAAIAFIYAEHLARQAEHSGALGGQDSHTAFAE